MKVSCIMPTMSGREHLLQKAIAGYELQDYPDKELVVIDDCHGLQTIGAKRNYGCANASGSIILHLDDDDWYAPDWISHSVAHLLSTGAAMTGICNAYFYKPATQQLWEYNYNGRQPYVIGASMCYHKSLWQRRPFKEINEGEDALFCANAGKLVPHNYKQGFVAMIHGANTASHKQLHRMKRVEGVEVVQSMKTWI